MEEKGRALADETGVRLFRLLLGIVLWGLLIGFWVYLWVPPLP